MNRKLTFAGRAAGAAFLLFVGGLIPAHAVPVQGASQQQADAVLANYAGMAQAAYRDASFGAAALHTAIDAFLDDPTAEKLAAARDAWKAARIPYLKTEGFRFANTVVDDWEPRVNAWPLDEGLIDYVGPAYGTQSDQNPLYALNVIANTRLRVGAKTIDATVIDQALLHKLQEAEGVQTNVSTGYHAIEFLLWGQNLAGATGGQGARPATDYDGAHCTHGNCARRAAYLKAAIDALNADLGEMQADWAVGGKARAELLAKGADGGLAEILTGMGSLSFGEMAGERMKLGLMLHDPEEQQDCFSNNTHNSHYYDETGLIELWKGRHNEMCCDAADGSGLRAYVMKIDPAAAKRLDDAFGDAFAAIKKIKDTADSGHMAYSQMIGSGNPEGNTLISDAMDALVAQTHAIEAVAVSLHVKVNSNKSDHNASAAVLR